jgi:hypothetical protein
MEMISSNWTIDALPNLQAAQLQRALAVVGMQWHNVQAKIDEAPKSRRAIV